MNWANPFSDLDDFGTGNTPKPVSAGTIEHVSENRGSRGDELLPQNRVRQRVSQVKRLSPPLPVN